MELKKLKEAGGVRLLWIALINSLPVALTSTLFLFFVEDKLALESLAGPLLKLFFLAAALALPALEFAGYHPERPTLPKPSLC